MVMPKVSVDLSQFPIGFKDPIPETTSTVLSPVVNTSSENKLWI